MAWTAAEALVHHAFGLRWETLPPEARRMAVVFLHDSLAVGVAGAPCGGPATLPVQIAAARSALQAVDSSERGLPGPRGLADSPVQPLSEAQHLAKARACLGFAGLEDRHEALTALMAVSRV